MSATSVAGIIFSVVQTTLLGKALRKLLKTEREQAISNYTTNAVLKQLEQKYKTVLEEHHVLRQTLNKANEQSLGCEKRRTDFLTHGPHELYAPLNGILGLSELLQRPHVENIRRLEFARLIYKRGNDLLYIVNNIIELSKIESRQIILLKSDGELAKLFDGIIKEQKDFIYYTSEAVSITFHEEDKSLTKRRIVADFTRLRQVLVALLRNAIQFTPAGSIVLGCRWQIREAKLLFYVSDTGIGIPEEEREIIFIPYNKVRGSVPGVNGGTGLGLAICKGIVECWGGEIWVDSIVDHGSIFYFTMPC